MSPLNKAATRVKSNAHYTCQECGSTEYVQAHHLVPGDDSTLVSLCAECHSRKHPDIPKQLFFQKRQQPYWNNKSAGTLARQWGVCSRTVIRAARKANILPGDLSLLDEATIKSNIHTPHHRIPQSYTTQQENPNIFLTAPELASLLNIHINTVRKFIKQGQLKAIKLAEGSRWRIPWRLVNSI